MIKLLVPHVMCGLNSRVWMGHRFICSLMCNHVVLLGCQYQSILAIIEPPWLMQPVCETSETHRYMMKCAKKGYKYGSCGLLSCFCYAVDTISLVMHLLQTLPTKVFAFDVRNNVVTVTTLIKHHLHSCWTFAPFTLASMLQTFS